MCVCVCIMRECFFSCGIFASRIYNVRIKKILKTKQKTNYLSKPILLKFLTVSPPLNIKAPLIWRKKRKVVRGIKSITNDKCLHLHVRLLMCSVLQQQNFFF